MLTNHIAMVESHVESHVVTSLPAPPQRALASVIIAIAIRLTTTGKTPLPLSPFPVRYPPSFLHLI